MSEGSHNNIERFPQISWPHDSWTTGYTHSPTTEKHQYSLFCSPNLCLLNHKYSTNL